jgi:hypothetical protein
MRKLIALSIAPVMAASIALAPAAGAAPLAAPTAALQLPNVVQIVDCTVALVEQLLLGGRPGSDCFGVP